MKHIVTWMFFTGIVSIAFAGEPVFHKVDVREGDGVLTLLNRYDLNDHVSFQKFLDLNQLGPTSQLIIGKAYFLPVLIYQYNGRSIRSTIGIDDWDLAVRIADYNKELESRGLRQSSYQSSKILWVPFREINGRLSPESEETASSSSVIHEPLFGKGADVVTVVSNKLGGQVFYIVSGHGGPDPGAMSSFGGHTLCEDEYAYDVSLRLARNLMANGATVEMLVQDPDDGIRSERYLNCDKDEYTLDKNEMPVNQLQRLRLRTELVNKLYRQYLDKGIKDQTVVCIHVDSQTPHARQDVYFYYCEGSRTGKKLAHTMQDTFEAKYQQKRAGRGYSGTVSSRGLYELRHTDPPAVYVELANIQNSADLKRLLPESNRQALANWLFDGLLKAKG